MPITPQDIEQVRFSKPPIGKRGYNEDEVDAFLDIVAPDLADYLDELNELRQQVQRGGVDPERTPIALAPPPPPQETPSAAAARILEMAERTADQVAREAEEISTRAVANAKREAADITASARFEASKMIEDARREKEKIEEALATLREFEKNYRERLDAYMSSQLAALRADGQVEPQS